MLVGQQQPADLGGDDDGFASRGGEKLREARFASAVAVMRRGIESGATVGKGPLKHLLGLRVADGRIHIAERRAAQPEPHWGVMPASRMSGPHILICDDIISFNAAGVANFASYGVASHAASCATTAGSRVAACSADDRRSTIGLGVPAGAHSAYHTVMS